ncbi:C163A protein, partial [Atlantisia rogersi]|nr:C163A protein [Atlantisia rogersi]
ACDGRAEVQVLGTWGTLCDSHWDLLDAHVLCRHLGCGFAESVPGGGHFGRGTGPTWRESFHCNGTETHLGQCPVTALGSSPCSHDRDAAAAELQGTVRFPEPGEVLQVSGLSGAAEAGPWLLSPGSDSSGALRLVGGGSRCDGRVEILQRGTWGRVLDDQWDVQEASVVCRQLRCG